MHCFSMKRESCFTTHNHEVAHDVGFRPVYHRIYHRNFFTLSNQTSRYILKCIRMTNDGPLFHLPDFYATLRDLRMRKIKLNC